MRSILTGVLVAYASCVQAHDSHSGWRYESFCCNGDNHTGDCQMIPSQSVKVINNGYQLTLSPGDHRLVTRDHVFKFPQTTTRRSQDSEYHLCLYPNEDTPRCFYAPDMSF
ncbi:hypothetical protein HGO38_06255 [Rhizobium sp. CG5]|uniref:hypothetical protein n=1 Tax=Rhizobium sp. CG5 TaxID=2726076 RepID=UPI00203490E4|nr:hypothetical protein [Rhizobium sp. CG5]MCM2473077.1 hypothetical protein [Rhizobium sp. CG5]